MNPKKINFKNRAMTVIEILVVIGVFIILLGIVVLNFEGIRESSRDSARVKDAQQIVELLENYYLRHDKYPKINNEVMINSNDQDNKWELLEAEIGNLPKDPLAEREDNEDYFYSYCVSAGERPQKYVVMARFERENKTLLDSGYKSKFSDDCNCEDIENASYLYCIQNP